MTISTNVHLLQPVLTIQGPKLKKNKNILSRFLPATKWKQVVTNSMLFTYLSVSISSFVKLLAIETNNFFLFSLILLSKSSRRVPCTISCMFCLVSSTWSRSGSFIFKMGAMLQIPRVFPRVSCLSGKSGLMPPSRAKNWRQKSANPALFPRMSPGSPPRDGRW